MLCAGEDELLCDLAETYGVLEPRALGAERLAVLAAGLDEGSRIRRRMAGVRGGLETQLLAAVLDQLALLRWQLAGGRPEQRPVSVLEQLCGRPTPGKTGGRDETRQNGALQSFDSPAAFEKARARALKGGEG